MNIHDVLLKLPKTDLHCHLDGSMRAETILDIAREQNLSIANESLAELKKTLFCGEKVTSLPAFLKTFDITCSVMQTAAALKRIAFEIVEDAAAENVRYMELRYYPRFLTTQGLSLEKVVASVQEGVQDACKKYDIHVGTIISGIRIFSPADTESLAHFAVEMKSHGVVGFDLASAEKGYPAVDHQKAFDIAAKGGLGITIHAGEDEAPWSIEQAIDRCHATRIGHGRTLIEDPKLIEKVKTKNIFIECCPSSNVQINLTKDFESHPVKKLFEKGVKVTLNTDNRLLTDIDVTDEYLRCNQILGMDFESLTAIALNGFHAAFLDADKKKRLIDQFHKEINQIIL